MLKICIAIMFLSLFSSKRLAMQNSQKQLKTGWYYIGDAKTSYQRQLYNSKDVYYIDPKPIVTVVNFKKMETETQNYQGKTDPYIVIWFDENGRAAWETATGKAIYKNLGLIIDDQLVYAPRVNSQITAGVSTLSLGTNSKDMPKFEKILRAEMQNATAKK